MARDLITIEIKDRSALAAMEQIRRSGINPGPMLKEIGEDLAASTKMRFASSKAPDGTAWAKNSPVTISRYVLKRQGVLSKDRRILSARGERLWDNKKPLIGQSKMLSHTIGYEVRRALLLVGSPMIYASTQQFGAEKGEFGTNKRGGSIPWGDIPARPFLGLSPSDSTNIVSIAARYLLRS